MLPLSVCNIWKFNYGHNANMPLYNNMTPYHVFELLIHWFFESLIVSFVGNLLYLIYFQRVFCVSSDCAMTLRFWWQIPLRCSGWHGRFCNAKRRRLQWTDCEMKLQFELSSNALNWKHKGIDSMMSQYVPDVSCTFVIQNWLYLGFLCL